MCLALESLPLCVALAERWSLLVAAASAASPGPGPLGRRPCPLWRPGPLLCSPGDVPGCPGPQAFTHANPSAPALPLIPGRHWPACETRRRGHFLGVLCAGSSRVNSPASTSCTFTAPSQSLPAGSLEQRGAPPTDGLASPASCLRAQSRLYPSSPVRWALTWELGRAPCGKQDKQVSGMEDGHSKQRTRTSQTVVSAESEEGGGPGPFTRGGRQEPGEPSCVLSHLPPALSSRCRGAWLNLPEPSSVLSSPSLCHSRGAALPTSQRALHQSPHSRGSHVNQWGQEGRCCTRFTDKDADTREGRWACLQAEGGQLHGWALRMDGQIREGCLEQAC